MIAVAITCLSALFECEGLRVATGAVDMASLSTAGSNAVELVFISDF
jgi:hypothetical protein